MNPKYFPQLVLALSAFLAASGPASANSCKTLDQSSCSSNAACSWIDGYKRSDGREVKAYCRSKPAKQSQKSSLLSGRSDA